MENDIEKAALEEAKIAELKRKRDLEHKNKVMAIPEPWGMKGQNNSQSVRPELPKRRGLYRRNSKVPRPVISSNCNVVLRPDRQEYATINPLFENVPLQMTMHVRCYIFNSPQY